MGVDSEQDLPALHALGAGRPALVWRRQLADTETPVAAALKPSLADGSRIDVDGKGSDSPIASNSTPEGRAKNRRVEIFIERSE